MLLVLSGKVLSTLSRKWTQKIDLVRSGWHFSWFVSSVCACRTRWFFCAAWTVLTSLRKPTTWRVCVSTVWSKRSPETWRESTTKTVTSAATVRSRGNRFVSCKNPILLWNLCLFYLFLCVQAVSSCSDTTWVKTGGSTVTPVFTATPFQRSWWRRSTEARRRSSARRSAGPSTPCCSAT